MFILERAIPPEQLPRGHFKPRCEEIVPKYLAQFGNKPHGFGVPQVEYVVEKYGGDPDYG